MGCNNSKQVQISEPSKTKDTRVPATAQGYKQTTSFSASKSDKKINADLYIAWPSPPCRAVLMTCAALGIHPNLKEVDLFNGGTRTPEFRAINPNHSVPTFVDGDFKIWESRPMMTYFVTEYGGEDNPLYPKDLKKQALIDSILHADQGSIYKAILTFGIPHLPISKVSFDGIEEKEEEVRKQLGALEDFFLAKNKFLAGPEVTVADLSVVAGITFLEILDFDFAKFPRISDWLARMKKLPYFEKCNEAAYKMKGMLRTRPGPGTTIPGDLYIAWPSAPCRAVLMACEAIGAKPNVKVLDLFKGESRTPEFLAINPFHTVPTYADGDFKIWESRAIMTYFMTVFGSKHEELYPKDLQKRAMVDNVLNADQSTFYAAILGWVVPQIPAFNQKADLNEKAEGVKKALTTLEEYYLTKNEFVAGANLTIADLSVAASVTFLELFDFDISSFPRISAWIGRMKTLPYYEKCSKGFYELKAKLNAK